MKPLHRVASVFIFGLMGATTSQAVQAGNMYIYKDAKGQVLLTNVNPSGNFQKFTKKVKVTYYPDDKIRNPTGAANAGNASSYGTSSPSRSRNRNAYDALIRASATRHGVDPGLLKAMMHTESAFNPNARSPVGAQGLMQLMPATARRFKVYNPWNPAQNIEGAAKYLAWLMKRFDNNVKHAVAGYNAGEGNVDKYGGIPPFKETRNYVKRVLSRYHSLYKHDPNLQVSNIRTQPQNNFKAASYNSNNVHIQKVKLNNSQTSINVKQVTGTGSKSSNNSIGTSSSYAASAFAALR